MIKRSCDRCGKELEPIYFPYLSLIPNGGEQKTFESRLLNIIYNNGEKTRPVDLCLECDELVSEFIFSPESIKERYENKVNVYKNGI